MIHLTINSVSNNMILALSGVEIKHMQSSIYLHNDILLKLRRSSISKKYNSVPHYEHEVDFEVVGISQSQM